jgi:hypothetical protein
MIDRRASHPTAIFRIIAFALLSPSMIVAVEPSGDVGNNGLGFLDSVHLGVLNIKATYPQVASLHVGLVFDRFARIPDGVPNAHGVTVSVEPGIRGTKFLVGYEDISAGFLGIFGLRMEGGGMIRYGNHDEKEGASGKKYLGADVSWDFFIFVASVGAWSDISDGKIIGSIGIGLGY